MENFGLFHPGNSTDLVPQINTVGSEGLTGLIPPSPAGFKTSATSEIEQLLTHDLDSTEIPSIRRADSTLPSQDLNLTLGTACSQSSATSTDPLTGQAMDQTDSVVLNQAIKVVHHSLTELADDKGFTTEMASAFGDHFNAEKLEDLRQQWATSNFKELPAIEIKLAEDLKGAMGAFSKDTNTIYLSQEYITQDAANPEAIADVLLEETGHYIDSRINSSDAAGDEGAIFSSLVRGGQLDEPALQALKVEDDTATIRLDNRVVHIEQASDIKIDFQPDTSSVPAGYIKDIGQAYNSTRGYGWVRENSLGNAAHAPLDIRPNSRDRAQAGIDPKLNTLLHMQYPTKFSGLSVKTPAAWEYALPDGEYKVTVSVGDPAYTNSRHTINAEGVNAISSFQSSSGQKFQQATVQAPVKDGKLTIDAIGGSNTKLNYIEIASVTPNTDNKIEDNRASINTTNVELAQGRDPAYWPFEADSPWNHPIGSGASYTSETSPGFDPNAGAFINYDKWSQPVSIASGSDPLRNIYQTGANTPVATVKVPEEATPDPQADGHLNLIDEKRNSVVEMYQASKRPNGDIQATRVEQNSLTGPGVYSTSQGSRAYGGSAIGGLIRKGELKTGIPHALAIAVSGYALNRNGPGGKPYTWPASAADGGGGSYGTTGNMYMGTLLAIPPNVDIKSIGLGSSGPGYEIARALQDYGAYVVDKADTNISFYAEPAAASEIPANLYSQLDKIASHLKVVSNNAPDNVGGGGALRRSFAPPLQA